MTKLTKAQLAVVNEVKSGFRESQGRDLNLSNEVLHGIIQRAGNTLEEMDEEQSVAFLMNAEKEANKVAASDVDVGIYTLAHKLDEDTHANVTLRNNIEAVMAGKVTAVTVYSEFKRIFSKDELDGMPYPGTDKDSLYLGNFKPDIVKTIAKTGSNAGQEITTTWTNDFVSSLALGKQYETDMADLSKAIEDLNAVPRFRGYTKDQLKSELSDAQGKRNALRSMVKRAIELHHMFEGIKGMPNVEIQWIPAADKSPKFIAMPVGFGEEEPSIKVTKAPKNLWIYPKGQQLGGRDFSVTQLLGMDVATAIANGGTLGDLVATGKKGANSDNGGDGTGDGIDMTEGEAYGTASKTINFFSKRENNAAVLRILADKNHPEHKDWVELIGDTWGAFYPLAKRIRREYETLKETKMEGLGDQSEAA